MQAKSHSGPRRPQHAGNNSTTTTKTTTALPTAPNRTPKPQLLLKKGKWHKQRLVKVPANDGKTSLTRDQITQLRTEALQLMKTDYYNYDQQKSAGPKSEDFEWIRNVLSNGTVSDKLAAHTVLIQDSSAHNLRSVEMLLKFINPKGKRECVLAIDNLRDLFVGDLLIPKEKLSTFEDLVKAADVHWLMYDPNYRVGQQTDRERFILLCHVEDQVRANYKKFIEQLIVVGQDSLDTMKIKSIRTLFDLFISNGEQERLLLSSLVNKLGDPLPKIASRTAHLLSEILSKHHPAMKLIVVREVERLLFRSNATDRSQYYCLCFLSEILFATSTDVELANHMIGIYLSLFNQLIKAGEVNNKMMSMLLTGVSRAFPYAKLEAEVLEKHLTTFYKIVHYVNLNTGIQTLSLIMSIVDFRESGSLTDRFYCVLYRFITNPQIDQCHKTNILLNVLYKALKKDPVVKRIRAFAKRLLQFALISYAPFTISVLVLISETLKLKDGFRIESQILNSSIGAGGGGSDEQERSATNVIDCSALDSTTMAAFVDDDDSDDEREIYYDDDEDVQTAVNGQKKSKKMNDKTTKSTKSDTITDDGTGSSSAASWVHHKNHRDAQQQKSTRNSDGSAGTTTEKRADKSDSNGVVECDVRNPLYSNAEREELWELFALRQHYHPTGRMFTEQLLDGDHIEYDGNPLDDFTVKRFLDRFVFRNPKTSVKNTLKTKSSTNVFSRKKQQNAELGVCYTPKQLLDMDAAKVPLDQQYIHQYLTQKKKLKLKSTNNDGMDDGASDVESVNSDEFDEALDSFECGNVDIDFADNFKKNKKNKKKRNNQDDDDEDEDDDDDDFDENNVDFDDEFDEDDFSGPEDDDDDDDGPVNDDNELYENSDGDDEDAAKFAAMDLELGKSGSKARNAAPFTGKRGFSKITNDIFASAEEFGQILGQNDESDSDFELGDDNEAGKKNAAGGSGRSVQRAANKRLSLKRKRMGRDGHKRSKKPSFKNVDL